eukprot:CAMPEP_0180692350 /NCGR_PEP_ID=MMETSP1038_2-20121128/774_1 /TAXON_ID=632150 /ORGANISM="Azadinium spinosum, Strain 3D9" /LENGTH=78 /DNA_ID=CAMNT_0022723507 /DNA_START=223 /DNA_END=456 /DNA_ORIENTATION=-
MSVSLTQKGDPALIKTVRIFVARTRYALDRTRFAWVAEKSLRQCCVARSKDALKILLGLVHIVCASQRRNLDMAKAEP